MQKTKQHMVRSIYIYYAIKTTVIAVSLAIIHPAT
jgi:hypothetical protein